MEPHNVNQWILMLIGVAAQPAVVADVAVAAAADTAVKSTPAKV